MTERTPSQTAGPFFSIGLCRFPVADLAPANAPNTLRFEGQVLDGAGEGVPDALVEIWQADESGEYRSSWGWARCGTDEAGAYAFTTVKPGCVPGPDGRPQAPHIAVLVFARGLLKPVLTRIYFPDEQDANASDPVLSAIGPSEDRETLIAQADDGRLRFDIRLQGDRQTVFFGL